MELTVSYFNTGMNRANLLAVQRRAEWRGIQVHTHSLSKHPESISHADIILLEGDANDVYARELSLLRQAGSAIKNAFDQHAAILATGVGYHLLGTYYLTKEQKKIPGLHLLHTRTVETTEKIHGELIVNHDTFGSIVGIEKHATKTYHSYETLGSLVKGKGNNGEDGQEGLFHQTLIGTNIQGPLLPTNPFLADQLLKWALDKKYGRPLLSSLDDTLERSITQQTL